MIAVLCIRQHFFQWNLKQSRFNFFYFVHSTAHYSIRFYQSVLRAYCKETQASNKRPHHPLTQTFCYILGLRPLSFQTLTTSTTDNMRKDYEIVARPKRPIGIIRPAVHLKIKTPFSHPIDRHAQYESGYSFYPPPHYHRQPGCRLISVQRNTGHSLRVGYWHYQPLRWCR